MSHVARRAATSWSGVAPACHSPHSQPYPTNANARSFIHSCIRAFVHSFIRAFVHSCIRSFVHSCIRAFVHSFIRAFVRSFKLCVRVFVYLFTDTLQTLASIAAHLPLLGVQLGGGGVSGDMGAANAQRTQLSKEAEASESQIINDSIAPLFPKNGAKNQDLRSVLHPSTEGCWVQNMPRIQG